MVTICHYSSYKKLNSLEKKKGLKGIYSKYGYDYVCDMEIMIERNGLNHIYGISDSLQMLFDNRIPCILCFVDEKISNDSILNYFSTHELDNFDDSFFKSNDLFISFHSVGCDGNSIVINYRYLESEYLFNKLETIIEELQNGKCKRRN